MNDTERDALLNDIVDALVAVNAGIQELLRRIPEPRCQECGELQSHHPQFGADHEFVP